MITYLQTIAKALVPVVILAVTTALGAVGISPDMSVDTAVALLVTAGLVWLVPNK